MHPSIASQYSLNDIAPMWLEIIPEVVSSCVKKNHKLISVKWTCVFVYTRKLGTMEIYNIKQLLLEITR